MTNQQQTHVPDAWRRYEREGFEQLERWNGGVMKSYWALGKEFQGQEPAIQLTLKMMVESVELPAEATNVKETTLWFGIGRSSSWQLAGDAVYDDKGIEVGRTELWSADPDKAGFVKTVKFWELADRTATLPGGMDILTRGEPQNAKIWEGMRATWVRETRSGGGRIEDYTVTLPVMILPSGVSNVVPIANGVMPPSNNGQMTPPPPQQMMAPVPSVAPTPISAAPSIMAPPPPVQQQPATPDYEALFGVAWIQYVASVVRNKPMIQGPSECMRDGNIQGQSAIMEAIDKGNMLGWMADNNYLKVDGANYAVGEKAQI